MPAEFGSVLGSLLALLGLTHAILRHRVPDMGPALHRSLVFTLVGAALLGSFHLLNVLAGRDVARREAVHSTLPGEMALVFSRQRELEAFVLIGTQRDGRALRSDEVAALRQALQSTGLEWHALRWTALQRHGEH